MRRNDLSNYDYLWIAISGGLADVINPHFYLKDRLTSWSHGLPFWLVFSMFLVGVSLLMKGRFRLQVALLCGAAYGFHLFCDGISGGINAFYPLRDFYWGVQLVPFQYWIPLDIMNLILWCYLFRWRKLRGRERLGDG